MEPSDNRKCEVTASSEGGVGSSGTRDRQSVTEVNSIQLSETGELVRDWRSQATQGEVDSGSSPRMVKGGPESSGCGWRSNVGEVVREKLGRARRFGQQLEQDFAQAAASGSQNPHSSYEASNDRGAKEGRKADPKGAGSSEEKSSVVPTRDKQDEEAPWQRHRAQRGVWSLRMLEALEKGVKGNQWFSLIDKVYAEKTLEIAWEKVKFNAGACGVDGISVEVFEKDILRRLLTVREQLKEGSYQPSAIKRTWINKLGSAEKRPLGIPTVLDRVVQTALRMVLEPIFEREFAESSYGFRPGRGCKMALRRVAELLKSGFTHVVDVDIKGYFDAIPHEKLMGKVGEKVSDGRVLGLIQSFLQAEVMEGTQGWEPEEGTPQGGVISPLLANIYLSELDWEMARQGYELVRYADDIVMLCASSEKAELAMEEIEKWMGKAELTLHPEKTRIVDMSQSGSYFDFLGYRFWRSKKGGIRRFVRPKSKVKLREGIRPYTKRTSGKGMEEIIQVVNRKLKGWYGYFKHADTDELRGIDGWVRGRLRSILRWRQGGQGRARGREQVRWNNHYFAKLGLFCLKQARVEEIINLHRGANC